MNPSCREVAKHKCYANWHANRARKDILHRVQPILFESLPKIACVETVQHFSYFLAIVLYCPKETTFLPTCCAVAKNQSCPVLGASSPGLLKDWFLLGQCSTFRKKLTKKHCFCQSAVRFQTNPKTICAGSWGKEATGFLDFLGAADMHMTLEPWR